MPTWNIVSAGDGLSRPNEECTEQGKSNLQRLLGVPSSRNIFEKQNENADIHLILDCHSVRIPHEIEFTKKMKKKGKKVILAMSADARWLNGTGLSCPKSGFHYAELLKEVDLILSEVNPSWKIYGRYQDKVVNLSSPLEHVNLLPVKEDIDFLFVGSGSGNHISYAIETAYMLMEKNPSYKCLVGMPPQFIEKFKPRNPKIRIERTGPHITFKKYLQRSKVLVDIQMRPRGGRVIMWGFYAGNPVVCSSGTFFSQLFPELTFDRINLEKIRDQSIYALDNKESIVKQAKELAKPFYFEEWKKTIYSRLNIRGA